MKLDDKDEKIIGMLRKNARTSNVEIAREVGLTEGAVRNRIDHLLRGGVIRRFTVETAAGAYYGIVMLKAKSETKKMMAELSSSGLASEAFEISGEYDGCAILEGASLEEVDRKIDRIRKLKGVLDTRTFIPFRKW